MAEQEKISSEELVEKIHKEHSKDFEEFYKNDELEGIRRTYTRNGIIKSKIQYRGGKKIAVLECDLDEKTKYEKINMFACIDLSNEILSWDII